MNSVHEIRLKLKKYGVFDYTDDTKSELKDPVFSLVSNGDHYTVYGWKVENKK